MELDRLRTLDVIGTVDPGFHVEQCVKLDTRLVRVWRFRDGKWRRRARLVAREFRDGDCSSTETFSSTTPLVIVKMMIVLSLVHDLAIALLDVGDAFLRVPQSTMVLIEILASALGAGEYGDRGYLWVLKRCLPRQRAAESEWNKFFTEVCERYDYETFQGKKDMSLISVHIDDLLVSKELRLKDPSNVVMREAFSISSARSSSLKMASTWLLAQSISQSWHEILNIHDRRGKVVPIIGDGSR